MNNGYDYERKMTKEEFTKLIEVIKLLGYDEWIEIYE